MAPPSTDPNQPGPEPREVFPDAAVESDIGVRFVAIANRYPEDLALSSPAGRWTYGQLLADVERRAGGIRSVVGDEAPTPVGVMLAHDGPLVVTMLAVVLAGHIVVVLDPQAPPDQTSHLIAEATPLLIVHDLVNAEAAEAAGDHHHRPVVMSVDAIDRREPVAPRRPRTSVDPAMLAFTSGTTGESRGATITHGVILNMVRGATNALGITRHDRMPMLFPMSLAAAAYPMFIPLLNGGTLATLDVRGVGLEPIPRFLIDERITLFYMSPTVVRFLEDTVAGHRFPDLRMVALGGEVVDSELVGLTAGMFGVDRLANGFGTTETGVISLQVIDAATPGRGAVPSGRPVDGVELTVTDDLGEPARVGESGEIVIASPHLFTGYWAHDDLDPLVLSDDQLGREGWRRYRTGDLGRLDADGVLTVIGRADTKVKVRGRFVVLGEVEALLRATDSVLDAVVVPVVSDHITELTALVVPAGPGPLDPRALRAALIETEETYRVPSRWIVLDELPLLPNGKLDRRSCAETASAAAGTAADVERTTSADPGHQGGTYLRPLRDVWEQLLPGVVVGPDDDFFHLGGDSLLAAQMLVMVDQRLGVTVPMGELIHATTLRALGEVVERIAAAPSSPSTAACVQAGNEDRPRLWFVHDLQGSAYRVRHLATELGPDQPVWSFESPLLRGDPPMFTTLETFAAAYLTDLRAVQPNGPYWLAGYCFGGICAYEMARQLHREGEEVAFVGVVDVGPGYRGLGRNDRRSPFRPWFGVAKPPPADWSLRRKAGYYRKLFTASPAAVVRHLMVRWGVARVVDPGRFWLDLLRQGRVRPEWRLWYAWEQHWSLAARNWDRTKRYSGRVDLFWASHTAASDATMGWGGLVDDLRIHRFEGDHEGVLEPRGAQFLAVSIRSAIDDLLSGRGGGRDNV